MIGNVLKKIGIALLGFIHGTVGTYIAIVGCALAFPGTAPGSNDYEEDMFIAPLGYVIMFLWLAVTATAIILLRKKKINLAVFLISWVVSLACMLALVFVFRVFI